MTHDELAAHLAGHLRSERRMTWLDVQLGPAGSPRPDVYAIFKSFADPRPMAFEVKVSAADLRGDVTSGKWQSYLRYACGVSFAMTAELAKTCREMVPAHCGLLVLGERWRHAKKPVLSPVVIPQDALLKLLIDGVEREGPRYRAQSWDTGREALSKRFGKAAVEYALRRERAQGDLEAVERQREWILEQARRDAELIRKDAESLSGVRAELAAVLGLSEHASRWNIEDAVRRLRDAARQHPAETQLERLTSSVEHALSLYGAKRQEPAA